jgi:ABC-type antimicrobial peptide transport system permease subunit
VNRKDFIDCIKRKDEMSKREGFGRLTFTYRDALRLGTYYIRRRIDRVIINIISIALANSFLTLLLLTNTLLRTSSTPEGTIHLVEDSQFLLVIIALVVSVVGITNAMLIAVFERYKEIGTIKCLGALDQHILLLFLVEAVIQGIIGGISGFILGMLAAFITTINNIGFDIIFNIPFTSIFKYMISTTILSTFLTLMATLYPALKASELNPIEALRYEL